MGRSVKTKRGYELPVKYDDLTSGQRRVVRDQYAVQQAGKCWFCSEQLTDQPAQSILDKPVNLALFPPNFLKWPVHLQHDHVTGYTEGAVHARCNAVLWQYLGR